MQERVTREAENRKLSFLLLFLSFETVCRILTTKNIVLRIPHDEEKVKNVLRKT